MTTKNNKSITYSIRLTPQLKHDLEKAAVREDRSASFLLEAALKEYLEQRDLQQKFVEILSDKADNGKFISEEKFMGWFKGYCSGTQK